MLSPAASRSSPRHPFASSTARLEVLPSHIDVEEEARLYEQLCSEGAEYSRVHPVRSDSPSIPPSVFSKDIWLDDHSGESRAFARDVKIGGWTNVGDKRGGAYIVYDCAIKTKEDTTIHIHKRYNSFLELEQALHRTLPRHQLHFVPPLPPKTPFARYRPVFLDRRRRQLQYWLSAVLLHPDIGSCKVVRQWVIT
ncbi:Phox-like protein [Pluteus cervinus]|uniref:Phox-like protein n=1 Tax=Pluteus cervinus TaxID=181527 RepID=A0ACD3AQN0_9AGAR|nr:Phox-like protein [Pluteus cervinus]